MGMAMTGLTHCIRCGKPLSDSEYVICNVCENKEQLEKQKKEKKRLERVLNIFDDMNEDDIKAFKQLVKKLGKEYKKKELEKQIKSLQDEIDSIDKEVNSGYKPKGNKSSKDSIPPYGGSSIIKENL